MGAEHAAVRVHLVDDDVAQIFEELCPFGVMGEYALVEHVGIAHDDVAVGANRLAGVALACPRRKCRRVPPAHRPG